MINNPNSRVRQVIDLAAELLNSANRQQTSHEKHRFSRVAGMMEDEDGKSFTMLLPDQALRSNSAPRVANQIRHLIAQYGVPEYMDEWEQWALALGGEVSRYLPHAVVPPIVMRLRQETSDIILSSEPKQFQAYLQKRRADGVRLNINQLGEAILGEEEASRRFQAYLDLLAHSEVEYISVKISSIYSQIHPLAFRDTVEAIKDRLRQLYRQATQHQYTRLNGSKIPKFVNLDMEEYRDLLLTVTAFREVLDEPEFRTYYAGIVLQAYLPDSVNVLHDLTAWAQARVADGGAPIKVRLVKGANLAMEQVEASTHGWEQAPYRSKAEVDANYKRMVTYALHPERAPVVRIGIASHNLFDIAYALLLRDEHRLQDWVEFEMLEGMANHQARAVQAKAGGLLFYAPVVARKDFHSAISYLVRRLDENTADENFLRDLFGLEVGSDAWNAQKDRFIQAMEDMDKIGKEPQRTQNRSDEQVEFSADEPFHNIDDTDWVLPTNQNWIATIRDAWQHKDIAPIPLQIGGEFIHTETLGDGHDPALPGTVRYQYALANPQQVEAALQVAQAAQTEWANTTIAERKAHLIRCAEKLAEHRGRLVGAMMLDGGKAVEQADPEVSEAIDFASYYARSLDIAETELNDCQFSPLGTVLVTPPWNFPLAIPCGGVLAAIMAGNTVILKPAPEAVLVGWEMVQVLWEAGIPKDVLQFVPTTDDHVGKALVTDERVNAVILTGAYETARMFLGWKPDLRLFAETSGKNSLIITAMADHDQAAKDLVYSAFGHAGQKCSAASLGVLEAEVYDNPNFIRQLQDAAASLKVGYAWDFSTVVTPVIREPDGKLAYALQELEDGEEWLLQPQMLDNNANLWSPGIKLGVQPGSFFHKTECFGPVLGLVRADNLDHAIEIVNDVDYGLTSGIHSLDDREIDHWRDRIQVGNAYINRVTTGAIVQRQPFGGWKKSAFGYAKAGGCNYVLSLGTWHGSSANLSMADIRSRYQTAWDTHFGQEHDPSQVLGEDNIFRYRPIDGLLVRVHDTAQVRDAQMVAIATDICGVPITLSVAEGVQVASSFADFDHAQHIEEDEAEFIRRIQTDKPERIRVFAPVTSAVFEAAHNVHAHVIDAPVVANGRLELRHYLREQAISQTTHRYGHIFEGH